MKFPGFKIKSAKVEDIFTRAYKTVIVEIFILMQIKKE